jgi:prepilin-type N-terminal cleavage/methylation domain-containing protein
MLRSAILLHIMPYSNDLKNQQGFSLTELLIALFISSFLMLVFVTQYHAIKRHYISVENALESSFNQQLIVNLLRKSIREAGFTPCMGIEHLQTLDTRTMQSGLRALEMSKPPIKGYTIHRMFPDFTEVSSHVSSTKLRLINQKTLYKQRPILIADCYHAEVHQVHAIHKTRNYQEVILEKPLVFQYSKPCYVGEWLEETFFVKPQGSTLYYRQGHTDAIADDILSFSATIHLENQGRLVKVAMTFKPKHFVEIETAMRIA